MNNFLSRTFKDYSIAIGFLIKFITLYIVLSLVYGMFIERYSPKADPVTIFVANNAAYFLNFFYDVSVAVLRESKHVPLVSNGVAVINVFEGCNSLNVMIVFISFLIASSNKWYQRYGFIATGILVIYFTNLIRVSFLYFVALRFPAEMYFFHKYLFTIIIYAVVFLLWFYWVNTSHRLANGHK